MSMRFLSLMLLCFASVMMASCEESYHSTFRSGLDAHPYMTRSDEELRRAIEEARGDARTASRQVLLVFVADWCDDCQEVVRVMREQPARRVIEDSFRVVFVDVGRFDRHRSLLTRHAIDRIAALVVLAPASGQRVARTTLEPVSRGEALTPAALANWLEDPLDLGVR